MLLWGVAGEIAFTGSPFGECAEANFSSAEVAGDLLLLERGVGLAIRRFL